MGRQRNPTPNAVPLKVSPAARAALKRHEQSCYDLAFKGSQHPDDWGGIEQNWERSRLKLLEYLQY